MQLSLNEIPMRKLTWVKLDYLRILESSYENDYLLIVPTPLVGGGTIYSNKIFCSDNFGRSIYSS